MAPSPNPVVRTLALATLSLFMIATLAPMVAAHHPGSNLGMARFLDDPMAVVGTPADGLVHHLADVDATFARWDAEHPELVERITIGQTSSGFDLLGLVITDESVMFDEADLATDEKAVVYLDGGHHGNEYLGVELVMYYLEDILEAAADGDEETLAFLATHEIHAVPIINVDGNTADTRKNSNQVDPNRNYPYEWGGPGSGDSPTALNYRGSEPMSEDEVRANVEYATMISPDLWITMHTGVAEFYWPWGWTHDPSPDDAFFTSLEEPFEAATNGRVDAMQAAELYLAAGATDDFGYGDLGVATFTFEVHEDQFIPVYGEPIPGVISDQLGGLDFMVKNARWMGAWIDARIEGDDLVITNNGWGNAPVIAARTAIDAMADDASGNDQVLVRNLTAGSEIEIPLATLDATGTLASIELVYDVLFIEATRTRTVTVTLGAEGDVPDVVESPAAGAALSSLALLLLVGAAARQTRRS